MFHWAARYKLGILMVVCIATLAAWGIDHLRAVLDARWFPTRHQRMLLYDLEHDVIRSECRRLLAEARSKRAATSRPARTTTQGWVYAEPLPEPPSALALLRPMGVVVDPDEVTVEIYFGGGFHHWSLHFYESDPPGGGGTKSLGGGLWFEDEFDHVPPPSPAWRCFGARCLISHGGSHPAVPGQRGNRKVQPVEVVLEVEDLGEPGPGEPRLVPVAVGGLVFHEPGDGPLHVRVVGAEGGHQAHGAPRRL